MSKAMIKFPGGVAERWERVAEFVNHLADPCHERTSEEVAKRVKDLRKEFERHKNEKVAGELRAKQQQQQPPPPPPPSRQDPERATTSAASTSSAAAVAPAAAPPLAAAAPPPSAAPAPAAALAHAGETASSWTAEQQRELEAAIKRYPASTGPERWDRIAESVAGKTKAECVRRFKEIAVALKARKGGGAAVKVVEVQ